MRKKCLSEEFDIVARVLMGMSYEGAAQGRASKSTMNLIVEDFRRVFPDFDGLRENYMRLENEGRSVLEVLESADYLPKVVTRYVEPPERNVALDILQSVLANRTILVPCRNCGWQVPIPLESAEFYRELIAVGSWLWFYCPYCRFRFAYTPLELLGHLAFYLLDNDVLDVRLDASFF